MHVALESQTEQLYSKRICEILVRALPLHIEVLVRHENGRCDEAMNRHPVHLDSPIRPPLQSMQIDEGHSKHLVSEISYISDIDLGSDSDLITQIIEWIHWIRSRTETGFNR